jgi:hypothetical protein
VGYRHGVLTLAGIEASTEAGHIIGLDLPPTPLRFGRGDPEQVLGQIAQLGGFALAAHPDAERDAFRWTGWDLPGYQGIEIFNAYSAFRRAGLVASLGHLVAPPFWQPEALDWEPDWDPTLVDRWARALSDRKLSVWSGIDAHGGIELTDGRFLPWPSYEASFGVARNYLHLEQPLTGSPVEDQARIFEALRLGRGYVALGDVSDGSRFRFWAERGTERWSMGSDIEAMHSGGPVRFEGRVEGPEAELRLVRDGVTLAERRGGLLSVTTREPGSYWMEARLRVAHWGGASYRPWIMSNPISILPESRIEERMNAAAHRRAESPLASRLLGYRLNLQSEPNQGCPTMDVVTLGSAEPSFRIVFRLGIPRPGERNPFLCAAVDRSAHDFSGFAGVRFRTRSDGIYRVDFELRDLDPGGAGWTTSFLTDPDWREVAIPFSQLRDFGLEGDDHLDLGSITDVFFLFDTSNTRPGTSGVVEIREFSLYTAD